MEKVKGCSVESCETEECYLVHYNGEELQGFCQQHLEEYLSRMLTEENATPIKVKLVDPR